MINSPFVRSSLTDFADNVVYLTRENIIKKGMPVTGNLQDSFRHEIEFFKSSFALEFYADYYWKFQEFGVRGAGPGAIPYNTDFAYTDLKPPVDVFIEWAARKPILPRDKDTGRFITRESFAFAVRESIYQKGIEPKGFFREAVASGIKRLPDEIVKMYGIEVDKIIKRIQDDIDKKSL